jgi:uncharacterized membrane protein
MAAASTRRSTDPLPARGRNAGGGAAGITDRGGMVAFLGAFCFFLSAVEYMIPKPLPFMRLGIANLPILVGAGFLPLPDLLVLALVKVLGMSLVSGTLFSYVALFSLAGTLCATVAMRAALTAPRSLISPIGASALGAVASNATQLLMARAFVFGEAARLVAPAFLAAGLVTGILLGAFARLFAEKSSWLEAVLAGREPTMPAVRDDPVSEDGPDGKTPGRRRRDGARAAARGARRERWEALLPARASAAIGAILCLALLFSPSLPIRASLAALFVAAAWLAGKRISPAAAALTSVGIVAANLLVPVGRVMAIFGPIRITQTALLDGLEKALVFEGLLYASKAFIRRGLGLPGRLGAIVASSFESYDRIVERKIRLKPATFIEDADRLLMEVWAGRFGRAGD